MTNKNAIIITILLLVFIFSVVALFTPMRQDGMQLGLDLQGGMQVIYQADLSSVDIDDRSDIMDGVVAVLVNRINPLGVTEPNIQKQGEDRILVELPGVSITDAQKESLTRTALLEFGELAADDEEAKWENEYGRWKPATAEIDGVETELTSAYFQDNTYVGTDTYGQILLHFEWNDVGSQLSQEITTRLQGNKLGIFEGEEALRGDNGYPIAPIVNAVITDAGVIEGLSLEEAQSLSSALNAGRLPVALEILYEQTVSPVLGSDFVNLSVIAGIVGIALVILFMSIYYRLPGVMASMALIFYAAVVLAIFKLIPVTLTLAGIGGFILSIGMAVDANVLIFERMKEEFRKGRTLGAAVEVGFSRAWTAIRDSNITTVIVCLILIIVGNSVAGGDRVMGFGITLAIGVVVSMFTAIVVTRTLLRLLVHTPLAGQTKLFSVYSGDK